MSDFSVGSIGRHLPIASPTVPTPKPSDAAIDFSAILGDAIEEVNDLQTRAGEDVKKVMTGEISDIHSAMIAVQKADVSFQMMMQVRNKLISAYQEIMKMQV